jgi:hypothetical protein
MESEEFRRQMLDRISGRLREHHGGQLRRESEEGKKGSLPRNWNVWEGGRGNWSGAGVCHGKEATLGEASLIANNSEGVACRLHAGRGRNPFGVENAFGS